MAIDTARKRANVQKVGRPFKRAHYSATIDEEWRVSVGNAYGGNAFSFTALGLTILDYGRGLMRSMSRGFNK